MARQLTFDLPANVRLGPTDFFVSAANETAFAMINAPQAWPDGKLALIGPAGSGKTHLARVFAANSGAQIVSAKDIAADAPLPETALVVEDGDTLSASAYGKRRPRDGVFHCPTCPADCLRQRQSQSTVAMIPF